MLDVQVFGLDAGAHHVTNVVLHAASALLLFVLLHRMTGAPGRSWFVAALFAVHPLHVESVAWIAERKDVLSTLFWMLTIWAYVRYVSQPHAGRYLTVVVLFALGLMAKPMLVTLPFTLLLLDVWPLGRLPLRVREKLPLFALTIASSVVTFVVQQQAGAVKELVALPIGRRIANALVAYVTYIGKALWPADWRPSIPIPSRSPAGASPSPSSCSRLSRLSQSARVSGTRTCLVGWLWYLVTLVPVIGLIQVGSQPIADRYTYVPLIGLFIIVAWGVPDLLARWPWRFSVMRAAAVLAIAACTVTARAQVRHWRNSVALWEHALAVTTANYRAEGNLGHALASEGRLDEAISHYGEAVRIHPGYAEAHNNLGLALARQGNIDEAMPHYTEAMRVHAGLLRGTWQSRRRAGRAEDDTPKPSTISRALYGFSRIKFSRGRTSCSPVATSAARRRTRGTSIRQSSSSSEAVRLEPRDCRSSRRSRRHVREERRSPSRDGTLRRSAANRPQPSGRHGAPSTRLSKLGGAGLQTGPRQ